jgi:hypothetical protein
VSGKAEDIAILNGERLTGKKPDSVDAGANAVDAEVPENHIVRRTGLDHDAVGAADENGSDLSAATVNGNAFGDGECAVTGWIKGVNFTTGGSFGDCACKRFARGSAAAGISVIAYTGHPRPGGLGAGEAGPQQNNSEDFHGTHSALSLSILIGALSAERGPLRAGRGFACVLVLEVQGSYQRISRVKARFAVNLPLKLKTKR